MNLGKAGLGVVLFVVFWAIQAKYINLGYSTWFVGSVIFVALLWAIGKTMQKQPTESQKMMWSYSIAFVLIVTAMVSYLAPTIPGVLGIVLPPGGDLSVLTPILLSFWLVLFGATKFVSGTERKDSITQMTGIIWLFSAITWVLNAGPNAYLHFAIVASLPFIINGLLAKKS